MYNIKKFETISSTNDYIKLNIEDLNHNTIIHSLQQTQGKGRHGNTWQSIPGNLYFSILKKSQNHDNFYYTMLYSLAVVKTLQDYKIQASIKYPNDILVKNQKISGILIETIWHNTVKHVIIGIGINVNQEDFSDLPYKATSICKESAKRDIKHVLTNFIFHLNQLDSLSIIELHSEYLQNSLMLNKIAIYDNQEWIIDSIELFGNVVLKNNSITKSVSDNEIKLKEDLYEQQD